jgi:hypothetical protein
MPQIRSEIDLMMALRDIERLGQLARAGAKPL